MARHARHVRPCQTRKTHETGLPPSVQVREERSQGSERNEEDVTGVPEACRELRGEGVSGAPREMEVTSEMKRRRIGLPPIALKTIRKMARPGCERVFRRNDMGGLGRSLKRSPLLANLQTHEI